MHLINGRVGGDERPAQRIYQEQYLKRVCPHRTIFTKIDRRLRQSGFFKITRRNAGKECSVRTPEIENHLSTSNSNPSVTAEMGVLHEMVCEVWRAENMQLLLVQMMKLLGDAITDFG